ncbi:MAG: Xaa-Pro peptidase family protein [Pseudomonadota bacterium]
MPHIHFSEAELAERRAKTCAAMQADGLDGMLIFRQESMFYLTGYDTFGYVFFQCLYLSASGDMTLLTRAPDMRQAEFTSVVQDIRIWRDGAGVNPVDDLKEILEGHHCRGKTLGVEWESYGLTAANGRALEAGLDGFCTLKDASLIVSKLRLVKSPAELDYCREAGRLADAAWDKAVNLAESGAFEGEILADMNSVIFAGGGDYPGNEFIIGSGEGALMCRYFTGRRYLSDQDQLTLEWAGTYRHYHAAMMRTLVIGEASERQVFLNDAAEAALLACEDKLRPGATMGEVFQAHADTLDARGLGDARMNACGYSLGTTFAPNWMDWPMFYAGNPVVLAPGMVFFLHMIVFDSDAGFAASLGRTSIVTEGAPECLSKADLSLVVKAS